jgi:hypothetical protein
MLRSRSWVLFSPLACYWELRRIVVSTHSAEQAFLEWAYEDENVRVREGADSYLIENGKIVAQTIHYTVEQKQG